MAVTLELTVQGDDAITKGFMHWSFSQAFVGSSGRLSHTKFSCRHMEGLAKLWLQPSWLRALNLLNITHTNSSDFTGTQYLAEKNTEYLFIVTESVTSSPS